jgi:Protein of unknown function (DUF1592)/Protein of unknown function (DUF1588)/Protein of unknown function (DUF1585)/Protein of unknown function (DUF1595)/Protein of unknown function (DUF1587)
MPYRLGKGAVQCSTLMVGAVLCFATPIRSQDPAARDKVSTFLDKYCLECHDRDVQKGEREFETFGLPLHKETDLIAAKEIVDQVTLREMPPKKSKQPNDEERLALLESLRGGIADARGRIESSGGRTVIRRLSNREYENTLTSLFDRRVDTLGLTADFPKERMSRHLDTIGDSLVTSGFLLDQYFHAANRIVDLRMGQPVMEPQSWHFKDHFVQYEELQGPHKNAFNYDFLCLYEQPNTDTRQGGYGHIEDFLKGVPASGNYEIEVLVQGMHRDTHYDPEIFGIDFSEPFQIGIVPGDVTKGHIHYPQAIEPLLASALVPDDKQEWMRFEVWLEAGQTPRFIFPNGPYESRASVLKVNEKYKDEFNGETAKSGVSRTLLLQKGKLPHIRIDEIKVRGPLPEPGGRREENAVFGNGGFADDRAPAQLEAFAQKAFRRPLTDEDRSRIRQTYERRLAESAKPREAALDTVKMILCSPSFLYFSEITDEKKPSLGAYDLASRLSYALWAGPPDGALLASAASGKLTDPAELKKQALRLLADERSEGFVRGFLDGWLNLREIGQMPPPRETTRLFYAENLPDSMKKEAILFFQNLLKQDGPIGDFLSCDYAYVDKRLASLYKLPAKNTLRLADGFQRVNVAGDSHRGGLLGMAAVLTVSANGVETSPVTRGVWVSENILGIEPPPPPDVVPAIDSDVSGATTIRERLARHSNDKTCAECHRKIDPLGFSLEHFDPIGRWRDSYPKPKGAKDAPKIDASGEFPSGETYQNFGEFKTLLATTREEMFARHLIEEFLSYSTGRHMEIVDQFTIDDILGQVTKDGAGLRSLVLECVTSEVFRNR